MINSILAAVSIAYATSQLNYGLIIDQMAEKHHVNKQYVKYIYGIVNTESHFKNVPGKLDPSHGLFQIKLPTGKRICKDIIKTKKDLYNERKNIECGVIIFKENLKKYKNIELAIASHNSGSPVYCKKTTIIVEKNKRKVMCYKGKLKNLGYLAKVLKASKRYL